MWCLVHYAIEYSETVFTIVGLKLKDNYFYVKEHEKNKKLFWIVCLKVWEWKTSVSTASSKEDSGAIWLKKREENEDFSPQRTFQTIQNSF